MSNNNLDFVNQKNISYGLSYARYLANKYKNFELPPKHLYRGYFAYQMLFHLVKPFTEWEAYNLGVINDKGYEIKSPSNSDELRSWSYNIKIIASLKRSLEHYVNDSRLNLIFQRLFFIRENSKRSYYIDLLQEFLMWADDIEDSGIHKKIEEVLSGDVSTLGSKMTNVISRKDYLKLLNINNKRKKKEEKNYEKDR